MLDSHGVIILSAIILVAAIITGVAIGLTQRHKHNKRLRKLADEYRTND